MPRAPSLELSVLPNGGGPVSMYTGRLVGFQRHCPVFLRHTGPPGEGVHGAEGARTPDLCNANAALSQLSYSPLPDRPRSLERENPAPGARGASGNVRKLATGEGLSRECRRSTCAPVLQLRCAPAHPLRCAFAGRALDIRSTSASLLPGVRVRSRAASDAFAVQSRK